MRRIAVSFVCLMALLAVAAAPPRASQDISGYWLGTLNVGPISLRLAFQFKMKDNSLAAMMISIDQGRKMVPCKSVRFDGEKLTFDIPDAGASYTGTINATGTSFKGKFTQGLSFTLDLDRVKSLPPAPRPQLPKGPFDYASEDVVFKNDKANINLAGTLTTPKGDGPFPAIVLVSGSGPQDRDETIFEHKPFLVIADHLARNGIACLRYDDRGVGKSKGEFAGSTTADFATDAHAAVKFLKTQKKIDAKKVGICGHSEGGIIAPLVASEHSGDVAFIILLSGPGIAGDEILYQQQADVARLAGATDAQIQQTKKINVRLMTLAKQAKSNEEAKEKVVAELNNIIEETKDEKSKKALEDRKDLVVANLSNAWIRWFMAYDPAPVLKKVKCPVLALNGEKDVQVRAKENLTGIAAALKAGGNTDVVIEELKSLNHLFQTCKTGAVSEYGAIEETIAPVVLKRISEWIKDRK